MLRPGFYIALATCLWLVGLGSTPGFAQQEWQDNLYNDPNFPNLFGSSPLHRFNAAYQERDYEEAATYLSELLKENPPSLTILHQAIGVYRTLAEGTEDIPQKYQYATSLMTVYEKRLYFTEDTIQTLNRKLNDTFKLLYKHQQYYTKLLELFRSDTQRLGQEVAYYNLIPYAIIASNLYRSGKLDKSEVLETRQQIESIVALHQDESEQQKYQEVSEDVEKILVASLNER